jgi:Alpha-L-rhamnosidase N-terminal domain./Bacterial alpha-L-rhamnosidase.
MTGYEDTVFTIDLDFTLLTDAVTVLFGASDSKNFYMWQIAAYSWCGGIMFRPHQCTNGSFANIGVQPTITSVYPAKTDCVGKQSHLKIDVNQGLIKTYVNGTLIDTRTVNSFQLGLLGFRSAGAEEFNADNIIVKNGDGTVIFQDNFSGTTNTNFAGGAIVNHQLYVKNNLFLQVRDTSASSAIILKPQVEQMTNPVGIDASTPNFSWQMQDTTRGQKQTDYRICVSSTENKLKNNDYDLWDSGKVNSDASNYIKYGGTALTASTKYYWKVYAFDVYGKITSSEINTFETGLMTSGWSGAKWITNGDIPKVITNGTFTVDVDFTLVNDAFALLFGASDSTNYYMWQIAAYSWCSGIMLRPHKCTNGSFATIGAQPYLPTVFPTKADGINKESHLKIDVNNGLIQTYVNTILVDTRTVAAFDLGNIGFRSTSGGGNDEISYADNVVVKNASGDIIFEEDFSDSSNFNFTTGTIESGKLKLHNEGAFFQKNAKAVTYSAPMLRKEFTIPAKEIKSARLYATAAGIYELYLNGNPVTDSYFNPGNTQYNKHLMYQTYDVTDKLTSGTTNAVGGILGHGWFNRANRNFGPDLCLYAKLFINYADGTTDTIVTDESWNYYWDGPILNDDYFMGYQYDANKEQSGWTQSGFDDSSWVSVKTKATNAILSNNYEIGEIVSQNMPSIKNTQILRPIAMTQPEPGVYIYDFGQNFAGIPRIKATAAQGSVMKVRYGEILNRANMTGSDGAEGTLYTENLHAATNIDTYTFKGAASGETFEPSLVYHGFRYMEITGLSTPIDLDQIEGLVIHTDLDETSSFQSSNSLINQFYSNALWSWRANIMSIPTDCPQRNERWGWTGDAQIFCRTGSYFSDTNQFFTKYSQDLRDTQTSAGAYTDVAPGGWTTGWGLKNGNATNGWGDAGVIVPWQIYQQYGNKDIITQNYTAMCAWVDYLVSTSNDDPDGFIRAKGWTGDWLAIDPSPFGVTDTAYCAYSAKLLSKMAEVIGNTTDAANYEQIFQNYKTAWNREYVNSDGSTTCNTQTSYLLGLEFGLFDDNIKAAAAAHLVDKVKSTNNHLSTGFLGVSYLNPVLSDNGYDSTAFALMEQTTFPSWLYSVTTGSTSIWESWDALKVNSDGTSSVQSESFNHYSYGAVMEWMFKDVLGIERDEANPGYKHIVLQPSIGGTLSYAKGDYDSIYGKIHSEWNINSDTGVLTYRATVPANTKATLYLPDPTGNGTVYESGMPAQTASGVTYVGKQDGNAVYQLSSGSYEFTNVVNENTITIENPQKISATVTVNGIPTSLPYSATLNSTQAVITVVSNDPNYEFACFTGDIYRKGSSLTTPITKDITLNTVFRYIGNTTGANESKVLSIDGPNGAFVQINGIQEALPFTGTYAYGTNLVLASSNMPVGKVFSHFSGIDSLSEPAVVTMNENISLTAVLKEVALVTNNDARGLVAGINNNQESLQYGWSKTFLTDGVTTGTGYTSGPIYNSPDLVTPITFDFDLGAEKRLNDIILYPRTDANAIATNNYVFPQDFTISVKDSDETDYTVVETVTGHMDSSTPVTFSLDSVTARKVRLTVTKLNAKPAPGDVMWRLQFAEIELHSSTTIDTASSIAVAGGIQELSGVGQSAVLTAAVLPSSIGAEMLTWTAYECTADGRGDLSGKVCITVSEDNSVQVKALDSGFVDIVARANDGSGVYGTYRLIIDGENMHYLTYDANGGIGTLPVSTAVLDGTEYALDQTTILTKTNQYFKGWGLTADAVEPVDKVHFTGDTTVYALWTEKPEWEFKTHLSNWVPKSIGTTFQGIKNGIASFLTSSSDADFFLNLNNITLDANKYKYLRVKLKNSSSNTGDGLYYANTLTGIAQVSQIPLKIDSNMENFKVYEYNLAETAAGSTYWKGIVTALRYDVITGASAPIAIDFIKFSDKAGIYHVALTDISEPKTGETPFVGVPSFVSDQFTAGNLFWNCTESSFAANTAYTVSEVLTPKDGFEFVDTQDMQFTVNGTVASAVKNADGTITISYTFQKTAQAVQTGDANQDGQITAFDAVIALQVVAGLITADDTLKTVIDVNLDNNVTAYDAVMILQYVAGLISDFH